MSSERFKTVVRRLPSNLPEDIFWNSVKSWVSDETVSWKSYFPGKPKKRPNKENVPSRAYIAFKSDKFLANFCRDFDGHIFKDHAGIETHVVVEFAPYQKVPSKVKKLDSRVATIQEDPDYISFLESLQVPAEKENEVLETLLASIRPPTPPKSTPLLEALKAERSAAKDKETILRSHAHHHDTQITIQKKDESSKKKKFSEAKGKASESKGNEAPPADSKKASKKGGPSSSSHATKNNPQAPTAPTNKPPKAGKNAKQPRPPQQPVAATSSSVPSSSAAPTSSSSAPPPSPARRGRPMIGLASRQFEAALNSAGVPSSSKTRREASSKTTGNSSQAAKASQQDPRPPAKVDTNAVAGRNSPSLTILSRDQPPPTTAPPPRGRGRGRGGRGRGSAIRGS